MPSWKRLSRTEVFKCPYYSIYRDRIVRSQDHEVDYHVLDVPGSVLIVPLTDHDEIIFVRQYRYPVDRTSLELPGGGLEDLSPHEAAIKELQEEAGVTANHLKEIGAYDPYNSIACDTTTVFLATGLTFGQNNPEVMEELEPVKIRISDISQHIRQGEIRSGETLAALTLFFNHHEKQ